MLLDRGLNDSIAGSNRDRNMNVWVSVFIFVYCGGRGGTVSSSSLKGVLCLHED